MTCYCCYCCCNEYDHLLFRYHCVNCLRLNNCEKSIWCTELTLGAHSVERQGRNKSVWLRWWLILCVNLAGTQCSDIWTNILYVFMKAFFFFSFSFWVRWTFTSVNFWVSQITLHSLMQLTEDLSRTKTDLLPVEMNSASRQLLDWNWTFSCVSRLPAYSFRFWMHQTTG